MKKAFTLIELLVVIAIIAVLATVVFVALNPTKRFIDARNSRRFSDTETILTAIHEYAVDAGGALPAGITTSEKQLGSCAAGGATLCTGAAVACLDLSGGTLLGKYLKTIPIDPQQATGTTTTGYSVIADANGIVTVKACAAEGITITASR
jgi:prepilin-type N-terminal cleavage/methylation domain-containing protein